MHSSGSEEMRCKSDGSKSYDIAIPIGRTVTMTLEMPLSRWMTTWMQWQSKKELLRRSTLLFSRTLGFKIDFFSFHQHMKELSYYSRGVCS